MHYKIWDNKAKAFLEMPDGIHNCEFATEQQAEDYKESYLSKGNYPDEPHTVLEVLQFFGDAKTTPINSPAQ